VKGKRLVCLADNGGKDCIVKMFFHPKRAAKHWARSAQGLKLLSENGFQTPCLYFSGYIEKHGLHAMIFEYLPESATLGKALANCLNDREKYVVLRDLMKLAAWQHEMGILQSDMNPGNYLIRKNKIFSIDGDHIRKHTKSINKNNSLKSLASLLQKSKLKKRNDVMRACSYYTEIRKIDLNDKDIDTVLKYIKRYDFYLQCKKVFRVMRLKN
jgi:tRNA A-37 threonylcarbamoyl transferase component Bud32